MAPRRIIIDTDPGVDDILALLLALSAKSSELVIELISVTFGNVEARSCLRNVVSMFHIIERERKWRREQGLSGFETMDVRRPVVAVGAQKPITDSMLLADYFHGTDGLAEIHSTHPHLTPEQTWEKLFEPPPADSAISAAAKDFGKADYSHAFVASHQPAHKEILRLLRENDPDTITIVAVGPMTNLSLAAEEDPETFLKVKEVVSMGGAIHIEGNVTPVAEFNVCADPVAAARIYSLTSPTPSSTLPIVPGTGAIPANHFDKISKKLPLTIFPVDITERHSLTKGAFNKRIAPLLAQGSPLAEWANAFMAATFAKMESLHKDQSGEDTELHLHDPLCIWYAITAEDPRWTLSKTSPEDIRIETTGQWTRGMCVIDRRLRERREGDEPSSDDNGNWLSEKLGNRVNRMDGSPGENKVFGEELVTRIFF